MADPTTLLYALENLVEAVKTCNRALIASMAAQLPSDAIAGLVSGKTGGVHLSHVEVPT